jgi:hypothetical protein
MKKQKGLLPQGFGQDAAGGMGGAGGMMGGAMPTGGMEGAVAFRDFVEKYDRQISIEDIFNGKFDSVKGLPVNDHLALIDKIVASDKLKEKLPSKTIQNIATYIQMLPSEAAMKLYKSIGQQNVSNTVAVHALISTFIVSIMTGGENAKDTKKK